MKHLYKICDLSFIFFLYSFSLACSAQKLYDFKVSKTSSKKIMIDGVSSEKIRKNGKKISLNANIQWPNTSEWMEIFPLQDFKYKDFTWGKNERRRIKCEKSSPNNLRRHNLFWWIKHNQTSAKSGQQNRYSIYFDYMINDTVLIDGFSLPIDTVNCYSLVFKDKDGKIKNIIASPYKNSRSFYFTKKQLDNEGYINNNDIMELRYNNTVVVDNMVIKLSD